jgi:hypothetical protein
MTDEETGFLTRDSLRLAESPEATLLPGLFFLATLSRLLVSHKIPIESLLKRQPEDDMYLSHVHLTPHSQHVSS